MKELPIIFNGWSVGAILDGRKTMTRRVIKHKHQIKMNCPYGRTGDHLWVRETWIDDVTEGHYLDGTPSGEEHHKIYYKVDDTITIPGLRPCWRPSIYMPRWASRITLEIIGVRVERVQDITAKDVEKEGINIVAKLPHPLVKVKNPERLIKMIAQDEFKKLWDSINAKRGYPWESNPPVWVIEFKNISESKK
jgi:hypothetical protein